MKTFENLKFFQRRNANGRFENGKVADLYLGDGFTISVLLGGEGTYSNGVDTYEAAIIYKGVILYGIGKEDVYSYITAYEITKIMVHLQTLTETEKALYKQQFRNRLKEREEQARILNELAIKLNAE